MGNIGPLELLMLGLLALLLFGPKRLPEIGRQLGRGVRDFRNAIDGTGLRDALDGMDEVRSAVSPTGLARAFVPGLDDTEGEAETAPAALPGRAPAAELPAPAEAAPPASAGVEPAPSAQ